MMKGMRGYAVVIGAMVLAVVVAFWVMGTRIAEIPGRQACTMEAKLCPDGSYVARTGPNCEFAACPAATATSTLAIGESATINGTTIGVLNLVGDSRCPAGAQCIQAGTVRVSISVNSYNSDFTLTLGKPQVVGNATITLVSVLPPQRSLQQTIAPSDYRFTFTVVPKPTPSSDASAYNSGVRGTVSLGPTCPVERVPPDPACADRPYATAITAYRANSSTPYIIGNSDASGAFTFSLPPGSYTLAASGGTMFPRCSEIAVTVSPNAYVTATISCDTGIR